MEHASIHTNKKIINFSEIKCLPHTYTHTHTHTHTHTQLTNLESAALTVVCVGLVNFCLAHSTLFKLSERLESEGGRQKE